MADLGRLKNKVETLAKEKIQIRGLESKFVAKHQYQDWLDSEVNRYFPDDIGALELARFAGYVTPNIKDKTLILGIALAFVIITKVDDLAENGDTTIAENLLGLLRSKTLPKRSESKILMILEKVINELQNYLINPKLDEFCDGFEKYLDCVIKRELQSTFTVDSVINNKCSFEQFWRIRRNDFAMHNLLLVFEFISNPGFSEFEQDSTFAETLDKFKDSLARNIILANELYSWQKDVLENKFSCNYLFLKYVKEEEKSLQEIADIIVQECNEEIKKIKIFGNQLAQINSNAQNYVNCCIDACYGQIYAYKMSSRYNLDKLSTIYYNPQQMIDFRNTLDLILKRIYGENNDLELFGLYDWIKEIYNYNVRNGKQLRGLLVVRANQLVSNKLGKHLTEDDILKSYVLGWIFEIIQAFALILDDIMDESELRRGRPCWYKKTGMLAINDALVLEQHCYHILRLYFGDQPNYTKILNNFLQTSLQTTYGQLLDMKSSSNNRIDKLINFNKVRLAAIYKNKTSLYSFVCPIKTVLLYHDCGTEENLLKNENILLKIGHLFQMQDDFIDCFGDPTVTGKVGTDIADGKCCWPIVTALELCDKRQIEVLNSNYGIKSEDNVKAVKEVYEELDLINVFQLRSTQLYDTICVEIQDLKNDSKLCSEVYEFILEVIYKRVK